MNNLEGYKTERSTQRATAQAAIMIAFCRTSLARRWLEHCVQYIADAYVLLFQFNMMYVSMLSYSAFALYDISMEVGVCHRPLYVYMHSVVKLEGRILIRAY